MVGILGRKDIAAEVPRQLSSNPEKQAVALSFQIISLLSKIPAHDLILRSRIQSPSCNPAQGTGKSVMCGPHSLPRHLLSHQYPRYYPRALTAEGWGLSPGPAQISWGAAGQGRAETGPRPNDPEKIPRMLKGASSPSHNELFLLRIFSISQKRRREYSYLWNPVCIDATLNK